MDRIPPMMIRIKNRRQCGELFAQWEAVQPGDALELRFDRDAFAPPAAE